MIYAKSETTIAEILTAAEKLFLARNYAAVSMNEIARAAGVTKGALYHHFAKKEALYMAMMLAVLQNKQQLFATATQTTGSSRQRLRRFIKSFLDLPREKRELIKLVRRDINIFRGRTRDKLVRAYQAALPKQVEIVIRDGIKTGEIAKADPRLLSWLHVALVEIVLTQYAEQIFQNADEAADFATQLFFNGAGKT